MGHILAVSADVSLLTTIRQTLATTHHTLIVSSDYQRLLYMLSHPPLRGIICVDLATPLLSQLLDLIPPLAQSATFILVGTIQNLPADELDRIRSLLIPIFDLPDQAPAFRQAIQQLAQRFPSPH